MAEERSLTSNILGSTKEYGGRKKSDEQDLQGIDEGKDGLNSRING